MRPPPIAPLWETRAEILYFQFGPVKLGEFSFKALSLVSNPFVIDGNLAIPLTDAGAKGCQAVVVSAVPIINRMTTMRLERGALRYAARYGDRYVVDLQGSFTDYLKKFSKKSRGNLQRTVKKFANPNTGAVEIREYRTSLEMLAFRDIAVAISHASYKKELGWGFQENESFARQLELDAANGQVRGYVLMSDEQPVAYVFCRIDHDVIVYKHIGYDERFAQRSPGTALLYLVLERLFNEGGFKLLDFDGTEYYAYKAFFGTRIIRCARVIWFRPRIRLIALCGAHCVLTSAWRLASKVRQYMRRDSGSWISSRAQVRQAPSINSL